MSRPGAPTAVLSLGFRVMALAGAGALLLAGCSQDTAEADAQGVVELPVETDTGMVRQGDGVAVANGSDRPASIAGVLVVEGEEHATTFRLFRSPPGFEPGFTTYLPEDMVAAPHPDGTVRLRYAAVPEGRGPFLEIDALPLGTTQQEARERLKVVMGGGNEAEERPDLLPGSVTSYVLRRGGWSARVDLVEHGGRYVVLRHQYPPEYGDGAEVRAQSIRDAWIWDEGSAPLMQGMAKLRPESPRDSALAIPPSATGAPS